MYRIAISGATGFIGSHLSTYLSQQGFPVVPLSRSDFSDLHTLQKRLAGCDVVIHLAGASIMQRWTKANKKQIIRSRVYTTKLLVAAINGLRHKPRVLISTSGVGIYPVEGMHTEHSAEVSNTFLGKVCSAWEEPLKSLDEAVRPLIFRLGVVIDPEGGILQRMLRFARCSIVLKMGNEQVPFPWVSLSDLEHVYLFALQDESLRGVVNVVAHPYDRMQSLYELIEMCYPRAISINMPTRLIRGVLGESSMLVYQGQYVVAEKLDKAGFVFVHKDMVHLYLDDEG